VSAGATEQEHLAKQKKLHTIDVCRENQLEDDTLKQFAQVCNFLLSHFNL